MSDLHADIPTGDLAVFSSVKECRWHEQPGAQAFERWHFDALSDDGREALVVRFHDNYALSPRYFRQGVDANSDASGRFPAVSFLYAVDGKTVLRTLNEFGTGEFSAGGDDIGCSIGASSFRVKSAAYGSGFFLEIDLLTVRKRRVRAELEWLLVESDLLTTGPAKSTGSVCWNIAAPRSDVSGRITLLGRSGKVRRLVHFRGTGYHDQFRSISSFRDTIGSRYWGRAHFTDSTVIFHYQDFGDERDAGSNLFLVREGAMHQPEVLLQNEGMTRTGFGLKIPERLSFLSEDNIRLGIKPVKVIQSGFFESRVLSEMTLMLRDGKPQKTIGITGLVTPKLMTSRFFRWLSDLRIGKNGKGPLY